MVLKDFCGQKGRRKPAEPDYTYSYFGNQCFSAAPNKILHNLVMHCRQDVCGLDALTHFVTMAATIITHQVVFYLTKYLVFNIIYMYFKFNLCTEFTVRGICLI